MTKDLLDDYFAQSTWLKDGLYGGQRIEYAEEAFWAATTSAKMSIKVLDAAFANDELAASLMGLALFDDAFRGGVGKEWEEEWEASAEQEASDFSANWPHMREHLRNLHMVSWVSAAENYVKGLLLQFSSATAIVNASSDDAAATEERQWNEVDKQYRKAVKNRESTSAAWVDLCVESSIPDQVKQSVKHWRAEGDVRAIDEMVLLRNAVVHKGGLIGMEAGQTLGLRPFERVRITAAQMARYTRAFGAFAICIDPTF